jgi:hypothetical protein
MARAARLAVLLAAAVLLAGCTGGPGQKPPIEATAEPAGLAPGTVSDLGLEPVEQTSGQLNTTIHVSIQGDVELSSSREVHATTKTVVYRADTEDGPIVVAVHTVPAVTLLGDTAAIVRNPAADRSVPAALEAAQSVYSVESASNRSDGTAMLLGNGTTIQTLTGSATKAGESVAIEGWMAGTRHDGDYVTVAVITPEGTSGPAPDAVLSAVVHPKNESA